MEIKSLIKTILITGAVIIVAFVLEDYIFSNLKLAGILPNIMLIVVSAFAYYNGSRYGLYAGLFSGLLIDIFNGYYLGTNALIFMLIGFITGFYANIVMADDIKSNMIIVAVNDALYGLIFWCITMISNKAFSLYYLRGIIIPEIIYTVLLTLILHYPLLKITTYLNNQTVRQGNELI